MRLNQRWLYPAVAGVLFSWNVEKRPRAFFAFYMTIIGGVYGVFMSRDAFLLFVKMGTGIGSGIGTVARTSSEYFLPISCRGVITPSRRAAESFAYRISPAACTTTP